MNQNEFEKKKKQQILIFENIIALRLCISMNILFELQFLVVFNKDLALGFN